MHGDATEHDDATEHGHQSDVCTYKSVHVKIKIKNTCESVHVIKKNYAWVVFYDVITCIKQLCAHRCSTLLLHKSSTVLWANNFIFVYTSVTSMATKRRVECDSAPSCAIPKNQEANSEIQQLLARALANNQAEKEYKHFTAISYKKQARRYVIKVSIRRTSNYIYNAQILCIHACMHTYTCMYM